MAALSVLKSISASLTKRSELEGSAEHRKAITDSCLDTLIPQVSFSLDLNNLLINSSTIDSRTSSPTMPKKLQTRGGRYWKALQKESHESVQLIVHSD